MVGNLARQGIPDKAEVKTGRAGRLSRCRHLLPSNCQDPWIGHFGQRLGRVPWRWLIFVAFDETCGLRSAAYGRYQVSVIVPLRPSMTAVSRAS